MMVYHNYRFNINKHKRQRPTHGPKTALCIPCKGINSDFERNITSFFHQDYNNYILRFVVEDYSDPAYKKLCELKNKLDPVSKAINIEILIAGRNISGNCSQKNHNLLYCCAKAIDKVEALAFADSDICVRKDWLSHLIYPLRQEKNGVSSGYRWFIPKNNTIAELTLSALNAKVAQLLGNTRFNQVWGGTMAIRTKVFKDLEIDKLWSKTISDDLSLSYAVKRAGYKVAFVPACLAASYEQIDWKGLFEFGRRQFLITRVSAGLTWIMGLSGAVLSVFGPILTAGMGLYILQEQHTGGWILMAVPLMLLSVQFMEAMLRQIMIRKMFSNAKEQTKKASVFDMIMFWPMSCLLLLLIIMSAFGKTIRWRGIRYRLLGPTETILLD